MGETVKSISERINRFSGILITIGTLSATLGVTMLLALLPYVISSYERLVVLETQKGIERKIDEERYEGLNNKLNSIESRVITLQTSYDSLSRDFDKFTYRIEEVERFIALIDSGDAGPVITIPRLPKNH